MQLLEPNTQFENRLTQIDIRFSKFLTLGKTRLQGMLDVYNLFNNDSVLITNTRYGPSWLIPSSVLGGRLFKLSAQVDF